MRTTNVCFPWSPGGPRCKMGALNLVRLSHYEDIFSVEDYLAGYEVLLLVGYEAARGVPVKLGRQSWKMREENF